MKIAIGTDHRGFLYKEQVIKVPMIAGHNLEWIDCGARTPERSDYPVFAKEVCRAMQEKRAERGILLCAAGAGMAIAANRHAGIYAAVVWNATIARFTREDDRCNVLVIPADFLAYPDMLRCIEAWLTAEFKGGRYGERLAMIDE